MRLMLGTGTSPSLLVDVDKHYTRTKFNFYVINGGWDGVITNGYITCLGCPSGDYTSIDTQLNVICDNQDRLRGNYNDVFNNFNNLDYIAPDYKKVVFDDMDDDIPF